jgi:hypothetical protein
MLKEEIANLQADLPRLQRQITQQTKNIPAKTTLNNPSQFP